MLWPFLTPPALYRWLADGLSEKLRFSFIFCCISTTWRSEEIKKSAWTWSLFVFTLFLFRGLKGVYFISKLQRAGTKISYLYPNTILSMWNFEKKSGQTILPQRLIYVYNISTPCNLFWNQCYTYFFSMREKYFKAQIYDVNSTYAHVNTIQKLK